MSSDASSSPLVVGFPLYEDCTLLDFGGATQVFAFAGGKFKPVWLSLGGPQQPIRTSEGVEVRAAYAFDDPARPRLDMSRAWKSKYLSPFRCCFTAIAIFEASTESGPRIGKSRSTTLSLGWRNRMREKR